MSSRSVLTQQMPKKQPTPKILVKPVESKAAETNIKRSVSATSISSEGTKTRRHLTTALNMYISPARCQRHMKINLGDSDVNRRIKEIDEQLSKVKPAVESVNKIVLQVRELRKKQKLTKVPTELAKWNTDINVLNKKLVDTASLKAVVTLNEERNELNKKIVRLSSDVSLVVATLCDYIVEDITIFAMDTVLSKGKKQVQEHHLVGTGIELIKTYPLIRNLPVFTQKRTTITEPTVEVIEAEVGASDTEGAENSDDDATGTSNKINFQTYVTNALQNLKKTEKYEKIRIARAVRIYLSDLVIAFIKRISNISQVIVQDISDVRTLNTEHVVNIVKLILSDEGSDSAIFTEIRAKVNEKLELYKEHHSPLDVIDENSEN